MAKCVNNYQLPLDRKVVTKANKHKSPAHVGRFKHSVDFACPEGTRVLAACTGKVVSVVQDFSVGAFDEKYFDLGNRIVLLHTNGEYTAYEHLKYKGSLVVVGQEVVAGEAIGLSGNTGFSSGPHLHFEVFNQPFADQTEGTTLEVHFVELEDK